MPAVHPPSTRDQYDDDPDFGQKFIGNLVLCHMPMIDPHPYSYAIYQSASIYPNIDEHVRILSRVMQMQSTEGITPLLHILVSRNPSEMAALRYLFQAFNSGTDISIPFKNILDASDERRSVKYALMGIILAPLLYDLWLLRVLSSLILINIRILSKGTRIS